MGSEARAERRANADADLQLFSEAERGRLLQKQKKRRLQGREDEVCYEISGSMLLFHYYLTFPSFFLSLQCNSHMLESPIQLDINKQQVIMQFALCL